MPREGPAPLSQSIRSRYGAWKAAGASSEVLSWIKFGVRCKWKRKPPSKFHQGASLTDRTPSQDTFWIKEKERLQAAGAWTTGGKGDYVSKAFLVPKGDKWRLVVDLRHLNSFMDPSTCQFETLKKLRRLAKKNDYLFSFDLQDGFYGINIHKDYQKFFTILVDGEYIQFTALPMGWNWSPYIFVKVMKTFVQAMRSPNAPLSSEVRRGNSSM